MTDYAEDLDEDLLEDPGAQLRGELAELLATLSTAVDSPLDFDQVSAPFDSSDVDFESDSWMVRVADVQGWMRFDEQLPTSSAEDFVRALADELDFADVAEAVANAGDVVSLSTVALDRLRERAELASKMQGVFLEAFESEDGTRSSATNAWRAAWESDEDDSLEIETIEPVSARADIWPIVNFTKSKLNLAPSYQRGDVWRTGARQVLIESILRGIPLPSIILLRSAEAPSQPYEVVDGKQRLTSILRFVGKHPIALERVREADSRHPGNDLRYLFENDYPKFRRAWKALEHESLTSSLEDEYYFPFRLRSDDRGLAGADLAPFRGKYYTQIMESTLRAANQVVTVQELFEMVPDYKVPVIIYDRANQRQIHEVFKLYNKQGMHLNAEEIRNAVYHELQITKATLVAAGDSDPRTNIGDIAEALVDDWPQIRDLQDTLSGYGFGDSRYRRTKVLSWIVATLLNDTSGDSLPSTARHIENLLQRVQKDPNDPLRNNKRVADLFRWVADAAEIHAAHAELWSPGFRDGSTGARWQELQLVGSLVGIAVAIAGAQDDIEVRIARSAEEIYLASTTWKRPRKTQTKTQWIFIAQIADAVISLLGVDTTVASAEIRKRFGSSGVESLLAVASDDARD